MKKWAESEWKLEWGFPWCHVPEGFNTVKEKNGSNKHALPESYLLK